MLTTKITYDTRLYVEDLPREGEVGLYKQSTYPGSEAKLLATFVEKSGKITLVLEKDSGITLAKVAEPTPVKETDDIPF